MPVAIGMVLLSAGASAEGTRHYRLELPQAATVRLEIPVILRAVVRINGDIALDQRDRSNPSYRPMVEILSVLPAGTHVIGVEGQTHNPNPRTQIWLSVGGALKPLVDLPRILDPVGSTQADPGAAHASAAENR